ncbi:MAG: DUF4091 domain-containing protein [Clostridia bacterium]|nr:DUF4091 domain-containing protein [Clostridia bacterium]
MNNTKFTLLKVRGYDTVLCDAPVPERFFRAEDATLDAARGAHDSLQIIICANEAISSFSVVLSDLKSDDGDVIKADAASVYLVKYTEVAPVVERFYNFGEGKYPNAILPFSAAEKYGENKISAGENGSVYISFAIPKTAAAGVYKGGVEVSAGGETQSADITLKVRDITLPEENHLRTLFLTGWDWQGPEKRNDIAQFQKATDLLTEYRLSPCTLVPYTDDVNKLGELYELHADLAYEYCKNPMNTTYGIPYRRWVRQKDGRQVVRQCDVDMGLDCDSYENFVLALINKSFEKKTDLLKKAVTHFGAFVDEPNGQGTMGRLEITHYQYKAILYKLAEKILNDKSDIIAKYGVTEDFIYEVSASLKKIPHIITAHYEKEYDRFVDTYCPCWWVYQKEDSFPIYENRNEQKWWYGCNGPMSPCPTYHLDDHLLSPRLVSWSQYKYGYVGNLFWAINVYPGNEKGDYYSAHTQVENEGSAHLDGTLAYPGSVYGLDKLVATLRLEAIRAGMEDYEVIRLLGEGYAAFNKKHGENAEFLPVFKYYYDQMTRGIKLICEDRTFSRIRQKFYTLCELNAAAEFCVCDLSRAGAMLTGSVYVGDGYEVSCAGGVFKTLTSGEGYKKFSFACDAKNALFAVCGKGYKKTVDLSDVADTTFVPAKELLGKLESTNEDFTYSLDGDRINFVMSTENSLVSEIKLDLSGFGIDENTVALVLDFDNLKPEDKFEGFGIKVKFASEETPRDMLSSSTYLPPKKSSMPIYFGANDFKKSGAPEYALITFGQDNDEYKQLRREIPIKRYVYLLGAEIIKK